MEMISKLSKKIALFLHREQIVDEEKTPVCAYGIELIISTIIGFMLVIIIGLIMDSVLQALFFYLVFVETPLRKTLDTKKSLQTGMNCAF